MVLMSLRGAPHSTTGVSPARMLFGRELSLPAALVRGVPPMASPVPARLQLQYPAWLQERLRLLHHEVRDRVNAVTLGRKERYGVRISGPQFQPERSRLALRSQEKKAESGGILSYSPSGRDRFSF